MFKISIVIKKHTWFAFCACLLCNLAALELTVIDEIGVSPFITDFFSVQLLWFSLLFELELLRPFLFKLWNSPISENLHPAKYQKLTKCVFGLSGRRWLLIALYGSPTRVVGIFRSYIQSGCSRITVFLKQAHRTELLKMPFTIY